MIQSFKEKYDYKTYHINKVNDMRYYCVSADINVPSVTSILRRTNEKFLNTLNHQSNTDSIEIGNFMHKYLEHYVSKNNDFIASSENYNIAKESTKGGITKILKKEAFKAAELSWVRQKNNNRLSIFDGIPSGWKDVIDIKNYPAFGGSKLLKKLRKGSIVKDAYVVSLSLIHI